jgi:UDP-2,3-diacylglucosamine hydrolase
VTAPLLFISDLHLDAARPEISDQFLQFLRSDAREAKALYILGDLFEMWIGDDDPDLDKQRIQKALRELTNSGVPCFVMHGNRDFLLGKQFFKNTGCKLIHDPVVETIQGRRVLLLHGDLLCTDDHDYQRLRRIVRNPILQWIMRHLTLKRRLSLAAKLRAGSQAHIDNKMNSTMASIMDVNQDAVSHALSEHQVDIMIHGHTHRPAVHSIETPDGPATRIVLGDWYTQGSVLRWDDSGYNLLSMART